MNKKVKYTGLALALALSFTACSNNSNKDNSQDSANVVSESNISLSSNNSNKNSSEDANALSSNEEVKSAVNFSEEDIVLRRALSAPHGEGAFARVAVVTQGDTILAAALDEFQYFDEEGFNSLPNQDGDQEFKEGSLDGKILGSKLENNEEYSKLMTEKADSEVSISDNFRAIEDFVAGKTIGEIEDLIADSEDGKAIDAISGATLVDAKAYLTSIVDAAKNDDYAVKADTQNVDNLDLKSAFGARNTEKAVVDVFVLLQNDTIVATSIDEYQYFGENGVPNSDKKFGENYADDKKQLASKLENDRAYSDLMIDKADATKDLSENYKAIEEFTKGKTAEDIKKTADENEEGKPVDAVSGATLTDTVGYLDVIYDAATN